MKLALRILIWLAPLFLRGQVLYYGKLGGGNNSQMPIRCLFYDTIDKKLYAGGQFVLMDNKKVWGVAVWNGSYWDSLRGGLSQNPNAYADSSTSEQSWAWKITRYQNKIYVAGAIQWVNRKNQYHLGVWNGTNWEYPIAQPPNGPIYDMKVINGYLYACGQFTKFGNVTCNYVARFDGNNWQPVGDLQKYLGKAYPSQVLSLANFKNVVYVAGAWDDSSGVARNIAKFDGVNWSNVGTGIQQGGFASINGMEALDDNLYLGGTFDRSSDVPGHNLVAWDGTNFKEINQFDPQNGAIISLTRHKNKVYAFGYIFNYGPYPAYLLISITDKQQCAMTALKSTLNNLDNDGKDIPAIEFMSDSLVVGGNYPYLDKIRVNGIGVITNFDESTYCHNVGLTENSLLNWVRVFPNPAKDVLEVSIDESGFKVADYSLLDNIGRIVLTGQIEQTQNRIELSQLPKGLYFLQLSNQSGKAIVKVIKQ